MAQRFKRRKTIFPHREAKKFKQFKWTFSAFVLSLITRIKIEKDAFVLVTGNTGAGKSHFVGNVNLKFLAKEKNFIKKEKENIFEKRNFIIDPREFAVKMITEQGSSLWIDEGRDSVNRQRWHSEINQIIASRKNRNRKNFNIYWLCMPYETEIDPKIEKHLTLWVWIRRGVGEIYCSASGRKGGKGLSIQEILKREENWLKENPKATFIMPTIHPEFVGRIFFNKLTAGYRRQYEALVEKKKAVGELTEEEKEQYGIIETRSPESYIKESIKNIKEAKITDKKTLWNDLKKKTKLDDDKLLKSLNFYLKLDGFGAFTKLFDKSKKAKIEDLF